MSGSTRRTHDLGAGAIVDHAVALYRQAFLPLVALGALWFVPYYAWELAERAGPLARAMTDWSAWFDPLPRSTGLGLWVPIVGGLLLGVWKDAACTAAADRLMQSRSAAIGAASRTAVRRLISLTTSFVVWTMLLTLLALASVVLLPLTVLALGGLVPMGGLVVWAVSPRHRGSRLKWLILMSTPFGLLMYWYIRWSVWGQDRVQGLL